MNIRWPAAASAIAASRSRRSRRSTQKRPNAPLGLIELEAGETSAYYTSDAARAPGAVLLHDNKPGNVEREVHHQFGDVDEGFADS